MKLQKALTKQSYGFFLHDVNLNTVYEEALQMFSL
jgi:hypothetical protein